MNVNFKRSGMGLCCALSVSLLAGCGHTPDAPSPEQLQQSVDTQIQSIQNNPNMPEQAKQQAIGGIKAQQSHSPIPVMAGQNSSSQSTDAQIQAIQNNPHMPPEAKRRAIDGIKFQQRRAGAH